MLAKVTHRRLLSLDALSNEIIFLANVTDRQLSIYCQKSNKFIAERIIINLYFN